MRPCAPASPARGAQSPCSARFAHSCRPEARGPCAWLASPPALRRCLRFLSASNRLLPILPGSAISRARPRTRRPAIPCASHSCLLGGMCVWGVRGGGAAKASGREVETGGEPGASEVALSESLNAAAVRCLAGEADVLAAWGLSPAPPVLGECLSPLSLLPGLS